GEHDDGRAVIGRAQTAANGQAIFAGHHQIQHDQIDGFAQQDAIERLAILGNHDLEAFLGQVAAQQVADTCVVIDDQDLVGAIVVGCDHGFTPCPICNRADSDQLGAKNSRFSAGLTQCYMSCQKEGNVWQAVWASSGMLCVVFVSI